MSLIADALKAALHEKKQRMPPPHALAPQNFFSFRSSAGPARSALPRGVQIGLGVLVGVGVFGVFVTLLLASSRSTEKRPPGLTPPIASPAASVPAPVTPVAAAPSAPAAAAPITLAPAAAAPITPAPVAAAPITLAPAPAAPITSAPVNVARLASGPVVPRTNDSVGTRPVVGDVPVMSADRQQLPIAPPDALNDRRSEGAFKITLEPPGREGNTLFLDALAAQKRGDIARARDLYTKAIERSPNNAELFNNVGLLYRSTGELERAEDAYQRAISINPKFAAAWSNLGVLLEQRGKRKEATAALQQALALDPSNTGSKVNLANQFYAIGVYADAKRLLEEVLRVNPSLAEAHYSLGRTLESLGEHAGAIHEYELFLTTGAGQFPALEKQVTQHLKTLKGGNDV